MRAPNFGPPIAPRSWSVLPSLPPGLLASQPEAEGSEFTVMTYNLLADMLCTVEQFSSVNLAVLDWEYRRALITREVQHHAPDILCLQELQGNAAGEGVDDHHSAMRELLSKHGYDGVYIRKVKRTGVGWPRTQIGNASFYRRGAFEYLAHEDVPIAVTLNALCRADEASAAHFGRGAQVGLAVALRHRESGKPLVTVTTHLSCNFQEPWTQVAQVQTVLLAASRLAAMYGPQTAVVMGADLNSIPGSGVYTLITEGYLPSSHPHLCIPGRSEPWAEKIQMPQFEDDPDAASTSGSGTKTGGAAYGGAGGDLYQPMLLTSAYKALLGGEPLFTNFTPSFIGTLDYIFGNAFVRPRRVLTLPDEDEVRKEGFLPAALYPSDHIYLLARFAFHKASGKRERVDDEGMPQDEDMPQAVATEE